LAEKAAAAGGRLAILERDMLAIKEHCKRLRDGQSFLVPIETLAPEPFILKKSLHVVVRPFDEEYQANFFDANIGMTGDTAEEAVGNLKQLIVDIFEQLESNEASLGPAPMRQLAVLRDFIQRQA
jgi:hypothetical protein